MSDRQGADVNWLVLQALIKSTKSPFSFHFLLQEQLTYTTGKREKRRRALQRPVAAVPGCLNYIGVYELPELLIVML